MPRRAGKPQLEGIAETVSLYKVSAESGAAASSKASQMAGRLSPLVGRADPPGPVAEKLEPAESGRDVTML